jgi:sugar lactone lactonase YvrE
MRLAIVMFFRFFTAFAVLTIFGSTLTACSGSFTVPVIGQAPNGSAQSSVVELPKTHLFVENTFSITEYTSNGRLQKTIRGGISRAGLTAGALAFDKAGALYAIGGPYIVTVYAAKSRKLIRLLTDGIEVPIALASDSHGNIYVGNEKNNSVAIFPPGASSPHKIIREGISDPASMAFDSAGNLYVANILGDSVTVYSPNGTLRRKINKDVHGPGAILLDRKDNLYVANTDGGLGKTVNIYTPPQYKLSQQIKQGIKGPWALAIDSERRLYVSEAHNQTVTVYGPTYRLLQTIVPNAEPGQLVIDGRNDLYVACLVSPAHVNVYTPGRTRPKFVIRKGITSPLALAIGPH